MQIALITVATVSVTGNRTAIAVLCKCAGSEFDDVFALFGDGSFVRHDGRLNSRLDVSRMRDYRDLDECKLLCALRTPAVIRMLR